MPKVAVLLCTYNGGPYLAEQLESIGRQTHADWQIWLSDDGSRDNTLEIARRYQEMWGTDRLVILKGPSKGFARNFLSLVFNPAIEADYFACADQDDVWEDNKIARAVEMMTPSGETPALYFSRTQLIDERGTPTGFSPLLTRPAGFANALVQSVARGNTMVINRAARNLLRRDPDVDVYAHDWWIYQAVTGCGGTAFYDPEPTLKYRQHSGNLIGSNKGLAARLFRLKQLLNGEFRQWNDKNIKALEKFVPSFTPENRRIFDGFRQAREAGFPARLTGLLRTGVYRQTRVEQLAILLAASLGRV